MIPKELKELMKRLRDVQNPGPKELNFTELAAKLSVAEWLFEHQGSDSPIGDLMMRELVLEIREASFTDFISLPVAGIEYLIEVARKSKTLVSALRAAHPEDAEIGSNSDDCHHFGLGCFGASLRAAIAAIQSHDIHMATHHGLQSAEYEANAKEHIERCRRGLAAKIGPGILKAAEVAKQNGGEGMADMGELRRQFAAAGVTVPQ
jgi:hypothetical protein